MCTYMFLCYCLVLLFMSVCLDLLLEHRNAYQMAHSMHIKKGSGVLSACMCDTHTLYLCVCVYTCVYIYIYIIY